jgi:copper homeostasis protein
VTEAARDRRPVDLEIAVGSARDATLARAAGATRVELCAALELGGVTPSIAEIEATVAAGVAVSVLVRSRPGDFVYDEWEKRIMLADARHALDAGATGIVIGALTGHAAIDTDFVRQLTDVVVASHPLAEITFHRAIDHCADPVVAVGLLADLGVTRVLTSGKATAARDGIDLIRELVAIESRPQVMVGGGVAVDDIRSFLLAGVDAIHLSAKRTVHAASAGVSLGIQDAGSHFAVDPAIVRAAREAIDRD